MVHWIITKLFGDEDPEAPAIACLTAVVGIFSGYALFLLWWESVEKGESGRTFAWALLAAAGMSFAFEFLRGIIEGSEAHQWTKSRIFSTILMLAAFELFIIAIHDSVELNAATFVGVAGYVFGDQFGDGAQRSENLVALGGLWLVVALIIVFKLRTFITRWPYANSNPQPGKTLIERASHMEPDVWRGAKTGFLAGAVWGPVSAGVYVIVLRGYFMAENIHNGGVQSQDLVSWGQTLHLPQPLYLFFYGAVMAGGWGAKYFGPIGMVLAIVALMAALGALASKENRPLVMLLPVATLFLALSVPILADRTARLNLFYLFWMSVVIWGVPATLLGVLTPFLRRPARYPPVWGLVACVAAAIMIAVTVARFHSGAASRGEEILLIVTIFVLIFSAALLFLRGWSEEFWMSVALSVGMIVWGTTSLVTSVNVLAMQKVAHSLTEVPLGPPAPSGSFAEVIDNLTAGCQPTPDAQELLQFEQDSDAAVTDGMSPLSAEKFPTPGPQISELTRQIDNLDRYDGGVQRWLKVTSKEPGANLALHIPNPCVGLPAYQPPTRYADDAGNAAIVRAKLESDRNDLQLTQAQHLELTMSGSMGFWVTIGLLAIWRLTNSDPTRFD